MVCREVLYRVHIRSQNQTQGTRESNLLNILQQQIKTCCRREGNNAVAGAATPIKNPLSGFLAGNPIFFSFGSTGTKQGSARPLNFVNHLRLRL